MAHIINDTPGAATDSTPLAAVAPHARRQLEQAMRVDIKAVLLRTIFHWWWLLLSIAVCVGGTYAYLLTQPSIYTRSADIIVKEISEGQSAILEKFEDLGVTSSKVNLNNEIANLTSKDLMSEVVARLNLDVNYHENGIFRNDALYGYTLPINASIAGFPDDGSFSFTAKLSKNGDVKISELAFYKPQDLKAGTKAEAEAASDKVYCGQLNAPIKTPAGELLIATTPNYRIGTTTTIFVDKWPANVARDYYLRKLAVTSPSKETSILHLQMSDPVIQRADDVITNVIDIYNKNWMDDRNKVAIATSNFLNERLKAVHDDLGSVESNISNYKSNCLISGTGTTSEDSFGQIAELNGQLTEAQNQLEMAQYVRSYVVNELKTGQLIPAIPGVGSSAVSGYIGAYNASIKQRNSLAAKSSDKNPIVVQLDEDLAAERVVIVRSLDNEITQIKNNIALLRRSEAQARAEISTAPQKENYLLSEERQQKVKESLYLLLLQKREEIELSQAFTAYNTRIVNSPGDSGTPVFPDHRNMLAIALLIGIAIPFVVNFIKAFMDTTVRNRQDLEGLPVPFLGELPTVFIEQKGKKTKHKDEDNKLIVREGNRNVINESFRVLRTNVEYMNHHTDGTAEVIAITSFNPHSGKTFISMNLGATLAFKNKRVLVIDGDLRRASASSYISKPKDGIVNYLRGSESDIHRLIHRNEEHPNLHVLPVGALPPNPTELLESPEFAQMLEQLRHEFDYILIDCPPIDIVADAQIIDRYVDRTIFIVRVGLFERALLPELDKIYEQKRFKNMSVILNGSHTPPGYQRYGYRGYGYSRYGYSRYGYHRYGYGYGSPYTSAYGDTPAYGSDTDQDNAK